MILRPYQAHAVAGIWSALCRPDPVLCVAATGAGKTEMFIELARRAGVKTAVIVGRDRLVAQTARRMRAAMPDVDVGVWSAGQDEKRIGTVTVVSIHSADSLTIQGLRLLILDECHNVNEGRYFGFISRHAAKIVGFTATPWRGNIEIFGDDCLFPIRNVAIGLDRLIKDGFLVPPVCLAMPAAWSTDRLTVRGGEYVIGEVVKMVEDLEKVSAQVLDALPRLVGRKKIVWTCVSINHAERVADLLSRLGETVAVIHSKSREPAMALDAFESGIFRNAVSVMMLTEGIDIPAVDAIVLMRPTRSATLMVQTIGRGLRLHPGKVDCAVLDYGEVIASCGPVNAPYVRAAGSVRAKEEIERTIRICPECLAYIPAKEAKCPNCGHVEQRVIDELAKLTRQAANVKIISESGPKEFEVSRVRVGRHTGKSSGKECVKVTFHFKFGVTPACMYISSHPFSFTKGIKEFHKLTPFRFDTFQELYDAADQIGEDLLVPNKAVVETVNEFRSVVRILD